MELKEAHEVDFRKATKNEEEQLLHMEVEEAETFFEDAEMVLTDNGVLAVVEGVGFNLQKLAEERNKIIAG